MQRDGWKDGRAWEPAEDRCIARIKFANQVRLLLVRCAQLVGACLGGSVGKGVRRPEYLLAWSPAPGPPGCVNIMRTGCIEMLVYRRLRCRVGLRRSVGRRRVCKATGVHGLWTKQPASRSWLCWRVSSQTQVLNDENVHGVITQRFCLISPRQLCCSMAEATTTKPSVCHTLQMRRHLHSV